MHLHAYFKATIAVCPQARLHLKATGHFYITYAIWHECLWGFIGLVRRLGHKALHCPGPKRTGRTNRNHLKIIGIGAAGARLP